MQDEFRQRPLHLEVAKEQTMSVTSTAKRRRLVWIAGTIAALCFGLQLFRPELKNPPVTADLQAPPAVKQILKNSCYSCHSNETQLPWFDKVVPAYWLATKDVKEARKHLNFSEIGRQPEIAKAVVYEVVREVQLGDMPPSTYTLMHPRASVTPAQLAVLRAYLAPQASARTVAKKPTSGHSGEWSR
jgi:hypothetical protein